MERRERKGHEHVQPATHDCHNKGTPETDTRPSKKQNTRLVFIIGLFILASLNMQAGGRPMLGTRAGLGACMPDHAMPRHEACSSTTHGTWPRSSTRSKKQDDSACIFISYLFYD